MIETTKAVFLSYASQDAAAARRLVEALQASAIEVWFDQSELRGGDAWDRQIRNQIRDCALFIPIISANTQARLEGYFRREWKLAADRTHDMAEEKAFLVPVVIDDTSERAASVPDRFREVQWIRLPGGESSPAFVERVSRLLSGDHQLASASTALVRQGSAATSAERPQSHAAGDSAESSASLPGPHKSLRTTGLAIAVVAIGAAALVLLIFARRHGTSEHAWRDPLAEARVTRLTDFEGTEQTAAISRDGKLSAFLAEHSGQPDIWVTELGSGRYRNLTQGRFRQLNNPEIRTVAFNPDGTLVTFWTRNGEGTRAEDINVMAVPTAGGALTPYLREGVEFDWSPDGTQIVFHTSAPGDPMFVRSGTNATAHEIYAAPPGIHCHFPTWSPDGQFIYFVRGEPPSRDWDIWRLRPSGAEPERITSHHSRVSYPVILNPDTLIYLATDSDGTGPWLYAMDMTLRREKRISFGLERYESLAASANGRRIVATIVDSRVELWRVSVAAAGPRQQNASPVTPALGSASAPRFGPDYVAFVANGVDRRGIWKVASGTTTKIWNDPSADRIGAPAIAPDGHRLAFTVTRPTATQVYIVDSDGSNPQLIASDISLRGNLAWSPDSQSLVGAIVRDGEPRLARISLDGSPPRLIVSEYSMDPVWSSDGRYFVYAGAQVATTFPLRAAAPDGRPYNIQAPILTRGAGRVAFQRNSGDLIILRGSMGHMNFWKLNLQSGVEKQLTDLPSEFAIGDFDVSADGDEIIFDRKQDSSSIALIEPKSS